MKDLNTLIEKIGYDFNNREVLLKALSHSSYANEINNKAMCNERLEFLGDSVLGFITAELLYKKFANKPEGVLTKIRAALVCEQSLFEYAKKISLGDYVLLGKGEEQSGGRMRPSLLADAFEAVIAAVYIDGGHKAAADFVLPFLNEMLPSVGSERTFKDYKTMLQEIVQKNPGEHIEYVVVGEEGPDHNKIFILNVKLNSNVIGVGRGRSKKEAEQDAAKEALALMGVE